MREARNADSDAAFEDGEESVIAAVPSWPS